MQNCYFPSVAKPRFHADVETKDGKQDKEMVLLQQNALRLDALRKGSDEMRPAFLQVGVVSGASGSAYVEFNRTRVLCSVYGPRNDTRTRREFSNEGQLVCDFKYAPFAEIDSVRERGQVRESTKHCTL